MAHQPTICIAERDAAIRALFVDIFHDAGYATSIAEPGTHRLSKINLTASDILLLDIAPDDFDTTVSLLERLRVDPASARLPVVLLTTNPEQFDGRKVCLARLGCALLAKPFQVDELLDYVARVLRPEPPEMRQRPTPIAGAGATQA